ELAEVADKRRTPNDDRHRAELEAMFAEGGTPTEVAAYVTAKYLVDDDGALVINPKWEKVQEMWSAPTDTTETQAATEKSTNAPK
ncbi:MAG: hypothetical protein P8R42_04825, partial [Candidatus Binatia bacterium]|nr:hypothetical protein [Candidatus Binatia bacterium]